MDAFYDALPSWVSTPEWRIPCPEEDKFRIVENLRRALAGSGHPVCDVDGIRVTMPEGWWLLRASNTEAALTVRMEAKDRKSLYKIYDFLRLLLPDKIVLPELNS